MGSHVGAIGVEDMDRVPAPITLEEAHEVLLSYLLLFRHGFPRDLEAGQKTSSMEEILKNEKHKQLI